MVTENKAMKHKDHVRKTQLGRVFCIQNFLDAPGALEFLFIWEWLPTPGLELGMATGRVRAGFFHTRARPAGQDP